ncbi:hypothetical protein PENANT_c001G01368 [Penicillium antarcticum]|uniref:NAD(P)-binding protein n=1 Tax=Penicillium antarcticum TaxID=416450 RepID=A0A1V6QPF5_9EURO|nr:hypothetical protein PENANT_c001G01368 [Penicillium antarcticum]
MSSYLVTGAGRGLGLEFVRQLSQRSAEQVSVVFAAIRGSPSEALQQLANNSNGRLVILHMAVSDKSSVATAVEQVKERLAGQGLDVLINNAGMTHTTPEGIAAMDNLLEVIQVNVQTVQNVTSAFLPLLKEGIQKKILNMGSSVGAISNARKWAQIPCPAYKISKAALNSLTAQYAIEYEKDGFAFFSVCPGWVKTDMGGEWAQLDVGTSIKGILAIVAKDATEINGKFLKILIPGMENAEGFHQYDGAELLW